jgi:hypothetical protein
MLDVLFLVCSYYETRAGMCTHVKSTQRYEMLSLLFCISLLSANINVLSVQV